MRKLTLRVLPMLVCVFLASTAGATELVLNAVQFPERDTVRLDFLRTPRAPQAEVDARVRFKEGQSYITVSYRGLRPAVLFGGDVTSYVLWAVTRDGKVENLGELWVRQESDTLELSSGFKSFALMITAESYFLVERPSELVMFYSLPPDKSRLTSTPFTFADFAPAPATEVTDVSKFAYAGSDPLDLLQAAKAFELAERMSAAKYAPEVVREASTALAQARNMQTAGRSKQMVDYARRSVALSSEALRTTARALEAQRLAEEMARRRAEMASLETEARQAEDGREAAESARNDLEARMTEAQASLGAIKQERAFLEAEMLKLQSEKEQGARDMADLAASKAALELSLGSLAEESKTLETNLGNLKSEKAALETGLEEVRQERDELAASRAELEAQKADLERRAAELAAERDRLSGQLGNALSSVADTRRTAEGYVVSLPDILFDVNKATLKPEAQLAIAKLAGILMLMPDLSLQVEGHTDSTGTEKWNRELSELRAASVRDLLASQGIAAPRMTTAGYGWDRPVADNATAEGRARNRRVEVVIAENRRAEADSGR